MLKIGKLEKIEQEELIIKTVHQTHYNYKEKTQDEFDTLEFTIKGNIDNNTYLYTFCLNCRPEKLLEITDEKRVDFTNYVFHSETFLYINDRHDMDFPAKYSIIRLYKNKFIIDVWFYAEIDNQDYSGTLDLELDLDDYKNIKSKKATKEITGYDNK